MLVNSQHFRDSKLCTSYVVDVLEYLALALGRTSSTIVD